MLVKLKTFSLLGIDAVKRSKETGVRRKEDNDACVLAGTP